MIEIKTAGLDDLLDEKGGAKYRFLIFGTPGAGKTPFAAQFPAPLVLAADRNAPDSLVITKTPYIEVRSEKSTHEAIDYIAKESLRPSFPYQTLVLDTYSTLQRHIVQEILRRENKANIDDFRQWGELTAVMAKILNRLHNLPMHLVVNVHTKDKFDAEELEPDLVGGAKQDLPKEFPNIGWLHTDWGVEKGDDGADVKAVQRKIRWKASPKFPILRSTSALLPDETTVTFTPEDFLQLERALRAGAKRIGATSAVLETVQTEVEQKAAPANVQGGPVEPKPDALPKPRARAAAKPKAEPAPPAPAQEVATPPAPAAAEPEPAAEPPVTELAPAPEEHDAAVEATAAALGAEVVDDGDPIAVAIRQITNPAEFTALWRKNKATWTPEHTALVTARKSELNA